MRASVLRCLLLVAAAGLGACEPPWVAEPQCLARCGQACQRTCAPQPQAKRALHESNPAIHGMGTARARAASVGASDRVRSYRPALPNDAMEAISGGAHPLPPISKLINTSQHSSQRSRRALQSGQCLPFNLAEKLVPNTPLVLPLFLGARYCTRIAKTYSNDINVFCDHFVCEAHATSRCSTPNA